jgi:ABC-type branched-subunit amino acid transport system substrate-binding protein
MNLLNSLKSISTVLISTTVLFSSAYADPLKICLTGSDVDTQSSYGQSFINGTNLAKLQSKIGDQVVIESYFYDRNPLSPLRTYDQMVDSGCKAIIGFDSLTQLMLIASLQANDKMPIFTPYANTLHQNTSLPKNFFFFMPPYYSLANHMMAFLKQQFGQLDQVLLITEVNRNEMQDYKSVYSTLLHSNKVSFDTFDYLENDNSMPAKLQNFMQNKHYRFVFLFTTGPDAAEIVKTINQPKTIYIGTEYFGSSSAETFAISVESKNAQAYFIRNLDYLKASPALAKFQQQYVSQYHIEPTILSAYAYDATQIILNTLAVNHDLSTDDILNTDYTGISGAYIADGQFHRSSNYIILMNSPSGYRVAQ